MEALKGFEPPFRTGWSGDERHDCVVDSRGRLVCCTRSPYQRGDRVLKQDEKAARRLADLMNKGAQA